MGMLKAAAQLLGKMVCLFTTPSMGQPISPQRSVSKKPVESGLTIPDVQEQSPAVQKSKPKRSAAQVGTKAVSRKKTPKSAQQVHGADGSHPLTPASQSQQLKRKSSAAKSTTAVKSRKQGQSQQGKQGRGLQPAIPASKMRQPAKPVAKAKPKAAPSTKAALLSVPGIAVVLTPTVVQSGERGKLKTRASKTRQHVK